jgi:hypothetical protein
MATAILAITIFNLFIALAKTKKPRQNLCFLVDDLASGHISWSHFGKSRLSRFQVLSAYLSDLYTMFVMVSAVVV